MGSFGQPCGDDLGVGWGGLVSREHSTPLRTRVARYHLVAKLGRYAFRETWWSLCGQMWVHEDRPGQD